MLGEEAPSRKLAMSLGERAGLEGGGATGLGRQRLGLREEARQARGRRRGRLGGGGAPS